MSPRKIIITITLIISCLFLANFISNIHYIPTREQIDLLNMDSEKIIGSATKGKSVMKTWSNNWDCFSIHENDYQYISIYLRGIKEVIVGLPQKNTGEEAAVFVNVRNRYFICKNCGNEFRGLPLIKEYGQWQIRKNTRD